MYEMHENSDQQILVKFKVKKLKIDFIKRPGAIRLAYFLPLLFIPCFQLILASTFEMRLIIFCEKTSCNRVKTAPVDFIVLFH